MVLRHVQMYSEDHIYYHVHFTYTVKKKYAGTHLNLVVSQNYNLTEDQLCVILVKDGLTLYRADVSADACSRPTPRSS